MVRHESSEALGAYEGWWEDVEKVLTEFMEDPCDAVRWSVLWPLVLQITGVTIPV